MEEKWKDIKGFEGLYQVSNKGRIRSVNRVVPRTGNHTESDTGYTVRGKILKQKTHRQGHKLVSLSKNGESKWYRVHILEAEAFLDNPNNNPFVLHKDDNPDNNNLDNLYWGTRSQNYWDRVRNNGHGNEGEHHGMSKLTKDEILDIRNSYRLGCFSQQEIANAYGVCQQYVCRIVNRDVWTHI